MKSQNLNTSTLRIVEVEKLKELKAQQQNLKKLENELKQIQFKLKHKQLLTETENKVLSEVGWLAALGVTITALVSVI